MKFKILWIEDKPSAVGEQKDKIEEFLKEKEFESDIEFIDDVENMENLLEEKINEDIDIIVTDYNLKADGEGEEDFSGLDVIKKISEKNALTDVLFYGSSSSFNEDEVKKLYNFVEIVDNKNRILEPLKRLIKKNIRRCEDPVFLRGYVLSKVVDLEISLNELFEIYFEIKENAKEHFHGFLMENQNFSFFGKNSALKKLVDKNKEILEEVKFSKTKLDEISKQRNLLAHSKLVLGKPCCFVSMGEKKEFGREELKKLLKEIDDALLEIEQIKNKLKKSFQENVKE